MRTTVTLDDDVYEAALHVSRTSGERLGKVLSVMARRGFSHREKLAPKRGRRFATFEVPPGTPVIRVSRIQRFLDEQGLF